MEVAIVGGHGQIARHLGAALAERGDQVRGLIRNPEHDADLLALGMTPVLLDIEQRSTSELADAIRGVDAVVFAAGAGPGSGAERKESADYAGAVASLEAARLAGVNRFVMISAMGTDNPPGDDAVFSVYLRAKARADKAVMESETVWTIVRPGLLTNDDPVGTVRLDRHVERGAISREDVAAVLVAVLDDERTAGRVFELVSGDTSVRDAIDTLVDT